MLIDMVKIIQGKGLFKRLFRPCGFLLFFCLFHGALAIKDDEMRWERAEKKVEEKYYSKEFKDSLRREKELADNEGLRHIPGAKRFLNKREKLVYKGGWGFIKAGYGIFDTEIDEEEERIILTGKAVTNNFVSAFYKVRDCIRTYIDLNGLYPYFFEQHIQENRYWDRRFTIYDHEKGKVFKKTKKREKWYKISPFTQNYFSLLYYLRTLDFAPGDTFSINCFVHGKDYPVLFSVLCREEVEVDAGTFNCLKVQPRLVGTGRRFTQLDKMYLWFTDDKYRMLVKGKTKVALGSITAELLYYERE